MRGALIDLAWKEPTFDPSTRELVGYELFRDDTSTRPPSRRTWKTMPSPIVEARGLEDLPDSEYGVQPIWRIAAGGPPALIEYGPPRLTRNTAGAREVMVPPEERIHSLSWLQHDGLITSAELDLAVEQLLGGRALPVAVPEAQPAPEASPELKARISRAAAGSATPARRRRVLFAYIAVAAILILVAAVAAPIIGRALFAQPSAVHISSSPTPTPASPSPSSIPTPTPTFVPMNLQSILIKPTDLRAGYVAGPYGSDALCGPCQPVIYSLSTVLQNTKLNRSIVTGASVAGSADDGHSVAVALTKFRSSGQWTKGNSLGDESYFATSTSGSRTSFYVVWRSRVMVEEIVLSAPRGTLTLQSAIDLAKVQQARAAAALART